MGDQELPAQVEEDLRELSPLAFEKKYGVSPTSRTEAYFPAYDAYDLPRMSDADSEALERRMARMGPDDYEAARRLMREPHDRPAVHAARLKVIAALGDYNQNPDALSSALEALVQAESQARAEESAK